MEKKQIAEALGMTVDIVDSRLEGLNTKMSDV
jgi:hypothetical protein